MKKFILMLGLIFFCGNAVFADDFGFLLKGGPWLKNRLGGVFEFTFDGGYFADYAKNLEVGIGGGYAELQTGQEIIKMAPIFIELYFDLSRAFYLKEGIPWEIYAGGGLNMPLRVSSNHAGYFGWQYFLGVLYKFDKNNAFCLEGGKMSLGYIDAKSNIVIMRQEEPSVSIGYKLSL